MKPRVSVLTIGVDDLDRALRFYQDGLGLRTDGIVGEEFEFGAVAFFSLQPATRAISSIRIGIFGRLSGIPSCYRRIDRERRKRVISFCD